jgi:predicted kinase
MKTLIILVGPPGSGKTTYAQTLVDKGYVRISQDANGGSKSKTTEQFVTAMTEGKNIVLDRCNINKDQRRVWINKAMTNNYESIIAVRLTTDEHTCLNRVMNRKGHETVANMSFEQVSKLISGFNDSLEEPTLVEGFTEIVKV